MSSAHSPTFPSLHLRHNSFSNPLSLYLHHSSFSNRSDALPTSQLILQPFCRFTYITAHSPNLLSLYLHHSSFSNPSVALPISQLILQPFHCFTYITNHSPTLLSLYLPHSSFSNPSFASPTSQDFYLLHLASRPWLVSDFYFVDTKHYIYNYCFDQCATNKSVGRGGGSVTFVRF